MYLIFAFDTYYPAGGWDDLKDTAKSLKKAQKKADKLREKYHFVQIVDLSTMKEV